MSRDLSWSCSSLVYSKDQLFTLRSSAALPEERPDVPPELKRRRRRRRARVERHARRKRYGPILTSIIMGNVRSLPNKMDELAALTRHQREYQECWRDSSLFICVHWFFTDPLQFAYQLNIGVDDAVIYLLHTSLTHLEKAGSTVMIMFFDFSSAFNTIHPRLLGDKLQGTVLAPFLFTLYTVEFTYCSSSCQLQKFSDDSAAVGLITDGDDGEYRGLIEDFVDWSLRNNLQINASKTKELVVDFRRSNNPPSAPVNILGKDVDVVKSYKYLGVHLNNNLDWTHKTDALVKSSKSRLFLLRRLRSFGVQGPLLNTFYDCDGICHLLWDSLLVQQHHGQGQEEDGQTGKEGQLCPGISSGLNGGGGKWEDDG
ncbi:hypothetical protein D4764_13G0012490 [Takifugu flavidus]|uniref:Reverse transcriptase domain-containing protein n=1 Tax=Takifugu flavidus TaxID=433684 RepID=A0A5C6PE72_9TELE|nr:hypothetical protein D4764_13G0012490 [Takifugu flavidus]